MMVSLRIPCTALALLSLLLLLAALGTDHWRVRTTLLGSCHEGLWKSCLNSVCEQISSVSVSLKVIRAFILLGAIMGSLSCFTLFASFLRPQLSFMSLTLPSFLSSYGAGLCALIAMAVYTREFAAAVNVTEGQGTFSWSFGLGWASFPLFLITGVVTLAAHRSSQN
ncbi:protein NKG7-like [Carettochelys insculpta]|uniref:protein NKG7-like n=1 Tax=Carettochelys insculpta TaxID=44489 RepID=UPI003EBF24E8